MFAENLTHMHYDALTDLFAQYGIAEEVSTETIELAIHQLGDDFREDLYAIIIGDHVELFFGKKWKERRANKKANKEEKRAAMEEQGITRGDKVMGVLDGLFGAGLSMYESINDVKNGGRDDYYNDGGYPPAIDKSQDVSASDAEKQTQQMMLLGAGVGLILLLILAYFALNKGR